MPHTLVTLIQDRPGALHRAVSLFRRRGFNIESLAVGRSEMAGVSRMTLVVDSDDVEQVVKQLYRLVEVIKVADVTTEPIVEREAALLKVNAPAAARPAIIAVAASLEGRIADVDTTTMVVEITGPPERVEKCIALLRPFGIKELNRSGRIVMTRGARGASAAATFARAAERAESGPAGSWLAQADGIA